MDEITFQTLEQAHLSRLRALNVRLESAPTDDAVFMIQGLIENENQRWDQIVLANKPELKNP